MARILIADDNPPSLRFLAEALRQTGHECTCVEDGVAARDAAVARPFDLLVLDARMPGLGGAAVLREVREGAGPSAGRPALATTASTDRADHARLHAAGFADVLCKPLAAATLQAAVLALLGPVPAAARATATATRRDPASTGLDAEAALSAAGGDAAIVAALRGLFVAELDALPAEIAAYAANRDVQALHERLHRLDASAGFCGAPGLVRAIARLRAVLADAPAAWPEAATAEFLAACTALRAGLAGDFRAP